VLDCAGLAHARRMMEQVRVDHRVCRGCPLRARDPARGAALTSLLLGARASLPQRVEEAGGGAAQQRGGALAHAVRELARRARLGRLLTLRVWAGAQRRAYTCSLRGAGSEQGAGDAVLHRCYREEQKCARARTCRREATCNSRVRCDHGKHARPWWSRKHGTCSQACPSGGVG